MSRPLPPWMTRVQAGSRAGQLQVMSPSGRFCTYVERSSWENFPEAVRRLAELLDGPRRGETVDGAP